MKYTQQLSKNIKQKLQLQTEIDKIEISEENLTKHMERHKHSNMIPYIPSIPEILSHPDYIGENRNVKGTSFECIKVLKENVLVAVKLDSKNGHFYVASMYDVKDAKLKRMLQSGRIRQFDNGQH